MPSSGRPKRPRSNRSARSTASISSLLMGIERQVTTSCSTTRAASPTACPPTTRCCGARAAPAKARWSRRCTPPSTARQGRGLVLIEIHREDIPSLPQLLALLRQTARRASCSATICPSTGEDTSYKSLKAVLEGGIEGRPDNVVFYATSNRRHLMPRDMIENERSTAINPSEAVEEKVSLSDRFGLWLGFHNCDQDTYLRHRRGLCPPLRPEDASKTTGSAEANEWSVTRGARSGRVAWQLSRILPADWGNASTAEPWGQPLGPGTPWAVSTSSTRAARSRARRLSGSTGRRPCRISKCSCGPVTVPVLPTRAMICAALHRVAALDQHLAGMGVGGHPAARRA